MNFNWEEYADLARKLRLEKDEASLRSAVSRVYYSALNQARVTLQQRGINIDVYGANSHDKIWREYLTRGKTSKAIWRNGKELHENRIKADYHDEIPDLQALVTASFNVAERVFTYLSQIRNYPNF